MYQKKIDKFQGNYKNKENSNYQAYENEEIINNTCGNIFFEKEIAKFSLNCGFCDQTFNDLISFSTHFLTQHLKEWNERYIQVKLESVDIICYETKNESEEALNDVPTFSNTKPKKEKLEKEMGLSEQQNEFYLHSNDEEFDNESNFGDDNLLNASLNKTNSDTMDDSNSMSEDLMCIVCTKTFETINEFQVHQEESSCANSNQTNALGFKEENLISENEININLKCEYCNLTFNSKTSYNKHIKKCNSTTKKSSKEKDHTKLSKEKLICEICCRQLPNVSSLKRHKNCHLKNSERPFKCLVCGKGFNTKKHLENHKKIHFDSRIYECDYCFMKFNSTTSKNDHQTKHSNEFRELVGNIGKKMAVVQHIKKGNTENLVLEINYSVPDGYWRCNICDKMFKNSYKQEEHKRFHDQVKPFICELCGKGMASQHILNYHILVHNEDRRFKCSKCEAAFFTSAHLKRHERTSCNSEKLFQCDVCQYRFNRKEHLMAHSLTHRKNRTKDFKCEFCNAGYLTSNSLRVHRKKHIINTEGPFKCQSCPSVFASKEAIRRHEKRHENKGAYKCEYCEKGFNDKDDLKQHMKRSHFDEFKANTCNICKITFLKQSDLTDHLKSHNTS